VLEKVFTIQLAKPIATVGGGRFVKPLPVMVRVIPPERGAIAGEKEEATGLAKTVKF